MRFPSSIIVLFCGLATTETVIAFNPLQPQTKLVNEKSSVKAVAIPLEQQQQQQHVEKPTLSPLAPQDDWIRKLDYEGFGREVSALGKELLKQGGQDDVEHLEKMVSWRNLAALVGLATVWMAPNPITIAALSTWTYASWTMIAHHTCHGGYNRVDAPGYNSRGFAIGNVAQRTKDWLDWMQPEAWNVEHNRLHHYRLNEENDPDLVQRNLAFLRDMDVPMIFKYATVAFFLPIWKWYYYAPNTFKELQITKFKKEGKELPKEFDPKEAVTLYTLLLDKTDEAKGTRQVIPPKEFFVKVLGPFFVVRLVALPAVLLTVPSIGPSLFGNAIVNLVLADLLTNIHSFITIVTNHAGEDLYTFEDAVKPRSPSFYVRQIVGSANYDTGSDPIDFSHGFLNYQIEHHVWPDLSMLQYQKGAPKLKAICGKYGVPYIQESAFERLRKTVDIMVGKTTMRQFPIEYEPAKDKALNGVTWKTTNGAIDEQV